jgi:Domain of unknown function (DUF4412)
MTKQLGLELSVALLSVAPLFVACGNSDTAASAETKTTRPQVVYTSAGAIEPAATSFEGEIDLAVHMPNQTAPASVSYEIKGNRLRYDEKSGAGAQGGVHTVADLDAKKAYTIMDTTKTYVDVDEVAASREPIQAQVKPTGKTETVAGVACEDWQISSANGEVDVCAVKGIPYFDLSGDKRGGGEEPIWAAELTKANAFPLRVVEHDKAGKESVRAEATRVEPKKLDDALMRPPTGYRAEVAAKHVALEGIP